jgi:RsiW-degrading membrane proteinase PrsW (M82 family)
VIVAVSLSLLFVAPFVFLYFLIIKGTDRYEPEPIWLLALTFFWGAVVATLTALLGNEIGSRTLGWALDARPGDPLLQASTASFVAPLVEESTKGMGLLLLFFVSSHWLHEIDGALDGAIYGGVVGLGFTLTEDTLYAASAAAQGGFGGFAAVFFLRTVMAGLGHASFTAMTGLGIGVAAETKNPAFRGFAIVMGWSAAVALHTMHNFLVTFLLMGGVGLVLKLLVFWSFNLIFFCVIVALGLRDRSIVERGLADEVGRLIHPKELERTASVWMIVPLWNLVSLSAAPGGYWSSRRKQLDLIKLAFLKHRRRRDPNQAELRQREQGLRERIHGASQRGVFVGALQ